MQRRFVCEQDPGHTAKAAPAFAASFGRGWKMELELLEEFTMVAKHANLSEAAKELHVSQPVLSRHLKTLEAEIGHELFDRSTSPMRLTPFGEEFLGYACRVTNEYMRLKSFVSLSKDEEAKGTVRLQGLIDAATMPILRKVEDALSDKGTGITIRTAPHGLRTPFDSVRRGDFDIAIEPLSGLIDIHGLDYIHMVKEESYVVMEASNPMADRQYLNVDDLAVMSFTSLRTNRDNAMRKHLQDICHRCGLLADVPLCISLSPVDTYDELLLHGLGDQFLMLPESLAKRYAPSPECGYVARPLVGQDTEYDICAFYLSGTPASVQSVIRELIAIVGKGQIDEAS